MSNYHVPILVHQAINGLAVKENGMYIDFTFGGGGYSRLILEKASNVRVIAFDVDEDAIKNDIDDQRFTLIHANFRYFDHFLRYLNIESVDGMVADLGVSSHHFDSPERGFSFRFLDSPIDLRMNKSLQTTGADILNKYDNDKLYHIFKKYGEVENCSRLVKQIDTYRKNKPIQKVSDLIDAIKNIIPRNKEHKYLAKVFQALRIEVNNELEALEEMLYKTLNYLKAGGRIAIVSYHSLEDSMIKNFFKTGNVDGKIEKDIKGNPVNIPFKLITRKPIIPSEEELKQNVRSRSAKLRIAERI